MRDMALLAGYIAVVYALTVAVGRMTRHLDPDPDAALRVLTPAEVADILIRELEDEASARSQTPT